MTTVYYVNKDIANKNIILIKMDKLAGLNGFFSKKKMLTIESCIFRLPHY